MERSYIRVDMLCPPPERTQLTQTTEYSRENSILVNLLPIFNNLLTNTSGCLLVSLGLLQEQPEQLHKTLLHQKTVMRNGGATTPTGSCFF